MQFPKAFGLALRQIRLSRGLTQEDFIHVSSRTYLSSLERGLKSPTLPKLNALAKELGVHPLTMLALAYAHEGKGLTPEQLLARATAELKGLPKKSTASRKSRVRRSRGP
jgi:transcriptional regulator with XRE-family HTH domain